MPSTARSAGTGATGCPVPSSASMRWMTVSCAIRRIQKPTVWSGVYQEPAGSSGLRAANSSTQPGVGPVEQRERLLVRRAPSAATGRARRPRAWPASCAGTPRRRGGSGRRRSSRDSSAPPRRGRSARRPAGGRSRPRGSRGIGSTPCRTVQHTPTPGQPRSTPGVRADVQVVACRDGADRPT